MHKDGTTDAIRGPRVTKPEGVFSLAPQATRADPIPSPAELVAALQARLPEMDDADRSVVGALLAVVRNGRYLAMIWESEGNAVRIHKASHNMPTVHFPTMHKQCGQALDELRRKADIADVAEKSGGSDGQPDAAK